MSCRFFCMKLDGFVGSLTQSLSSDHRRDREGVVVVCSADSASSSSRRTRRPGSPLGSLRSVLGSRGMRRGGDGLGLHGCELGAWHRQFVRNSAPRHAAGLSAARPFEVGNLATARPGTLPELPASSIQPEGAVPAQSPNFRFELNATARRRDIRPRPPRCFRADTRTVALTPRVSRVRKLSCRGRRPRPCTTPMRNGFTSAGSIVRPTCSPAAANSSSTPWLRPLMSCTGPV